MREAAPLIISLHADLFFEWEQSLQGDWPDAECVIYHLWDQGLLTTESFILGPSATLQQIHYFCTIFHFFTSEWTTRFAPSPAASAIISLPKPNQYISWQIYIGI